MSLGHGATIVRDGLVLYLDAANEKSYPGSGTTWSDLSGNGYDGTLVNGPTFNSTNGGSFQFDRVDDAVTATVTNINTTTYSYVTVDFYMKWDGSPGGFPMEFTNYRLWFSGPNTLGFNRSAGDSYGFTDSSMVNNWVHLVAIFHNQAQSNSSMYLNGVQKTLSQKNGTIGNAFVSSQLTIGRYRPGGYPFGGYITNFKIYNKALSAAEITQNFEATRGRFGI
jgi:hypothetical protein